MVWALLGAMTVLAMGLALWPLFLRKNIAANSSSEIDFYIKQLGEVERDIERGQLPATEADVTRAEIGRRLIGLQKEKASFIPFRDNEAQRRLALTIGLVLIPLLGALLYSIYGHPALKDMPLAARDDVEPGTDPILAAVARIETEIAASPDNLKAWTVLAPVYMRLGRYSDAVTAYRRILQLNGEDPESRANLGEAQVAVANGIVTEEAKRDFTKALADDPSLAIAQYYLGLEAEQAGNAQQAIGIYEALLGKVSDRPNWVKVIKARLALLKNEEPATSADTKAESEMIEGMVARLAARLEQESGSADDWARLIRSYAVLGKSDKAKQTLDKARQIFTSDATATKQLHILAGELGLVWQ